jgi:CubicO group peptidase (beta-lactamase class C family)
MQYWSGPLKVLDTWVAEGVVNGASAAVWHDGEIVASHQAGDAKPGQPVTPETLFALASVSKPITAAAIMLAVQDGSLSLDAPVASLVPDFGEVDDPLDSDVVPQLEALRHRISLRQLLSHTSGLPENVGTKRIRMRDLPSLDTIVDAMCGVPLQSAPGEVLRYSNVGIGIAGRALELATGRSVHGTIDQDVLPLLELNDIATHPDQSWDSRIAIVQDPSSAGTPAESYNSEWWRSVGITWGGYFGTPIDLARFAASFFSGAASPLDDETKAETTTDQTGGVPGGVNSAGIHWEHGAWGLGWEVASDKRQHWTGTLRSPRTFCHWGQSGTLVWADPERDLVLAVFANRSVLKPWPLRPPRWAPLSDELVKAHDSHRPH